MIGRVFGIRKISWELLKSAKGVVGNVLGIERKNTKGFEKKTKLESRLLGVGGKGGRITNPWGGGKRKKKKKGARDANEESSRMTRRGGGGQPGWKP